MSDVLAAIGVGFLKLVIYGFVALIVLLLLWVVLAAWTDNWNSPERLWSLPVFLAICYLVGKGHV